MRKANRSIVVVFAALTIKQREVMRERLKGRSFEDIASSYGVSKQAVECSERRAFAKLGCDVSMEDILGAKAREEMREVYRERGQRAELRLLTCNHDDEIARRGRYRDQVNRDDLEKRLEQILNNGGSWQEYERIQKQLA